MFKNFKPITALAGITILAVGIAMPLPLSSPHSAKDTSSEVSIVSDGFYYTVSELRLGEEEITYTYTKKKPSPKCTIIKSGKNKGKQRCCTIIKSGKNKGKQRCKIRPVRQNPLVSNPVVDPIIPNPSSPQPAPAPVEPPYSVDPNSLEFEGPLLGSATEYSFLSLGSNGVPARWNKCSPVRYRINPNGLSPSALEDVNEAIRRLSLASQIRFEYAGPTNVIPYLTNNWYETIPTEERRSAELWIGFSDESVVRALAGSTIGLGGPIWQESTRGNTDARIVAAGMIFDTVPNLEPGFGTGAKRGSLIMHELGHVMNLGHVGDQVQIMFPSLFEETKSMYQNGDIAGFRQLHSYPCF
jgi:hypothetical protein